MHVYSPKMPAAGSIAVLPKSVRGLPIPCCSGQRNSVARLQPTGRLAVAECEFVAVSAHASVGTSSPRSWLDGFLKPEFCILTLTLASTPLTQ